MPQELLCLEAAACILWAAAAAFRARLGGNHFTGAALLGLMCGLCPLLLRMCLPAPPGQNWDWLLAHYAPWALAGAVTGGLLPQVAVFSRHDASLFFWLESLALGLTTSLQVMLLLLFWSPASALTLAVLLGLVPGLLRDVALGYVASLVEESWYGTAAALGAMLTLVCALFGAAGGFPLGLPGRSWEAISVLLGTLLTLVLRICWGRRG